MKLGDRIRCKVTGYEGVAVAKLKHLNGCVQYGLKGKMVKDGEYPETVYLDVEQLEKIEDNAVKVKPSPTGGSETRNVGRH